VEQMYGWCSTGKRVRKQDISLHWETRTTSPTSAERCLSLKVTKDAQFELTSANCAAKSSFVCEVYHVKRDRGKCLIFLFQAEMRRCILPSRLQSRRNVKLNFPTFTVIIHCRQITMSNLRVDKKQWR